LGVQDTALLLTVAEFLKLPDPPEGHIELHHGEAVEMPTPKSGHQKIQDRLQMLLKKLLGEAYAVRMEMAFRPTPEHEVWVADVGCVLWERDDETPADEYLKGAPELVVEVLSPSNTVDEVNDKMFICMANGCQSFWVVDPKRQVVSVTQGAVTTHYSVQATIVVSSSPGKQRFHPGEQLQILRVGAHLPEG
jgi:Uma2 family endonuclease